MEIAVSFGPSADDESGVVAAGLEPRRILGREAVVVQDQID